MRRAIKTFLLTGLVLLGLLQGAWAYTPGGPPDNNPKPNGTAGEIGDSWQQPVIGLNLPGDLLGPKMIGQEYRRDLPVMYYACDASFLNYFGSNGMAAVDQTFAIFNSTFTNNPTGATNGLDGYSSFLNEFPYETRHFNYQAQALGVYDLKSVAMGAMMEQLGLADPVRFDWTLHDRFNVGPAGCPADMEYLVVQRNFDPVTTALGNPQTTPYVNNTLYSYQIEETCGPNNPFALPVPYSVDPLADTYSPVASSIGGVIEQQTSLGLVGAFAPGIYSYGAFYSGLTRDDVAGLRYLLTQTNIVTETPDPTSVLYTITTNFAPQEFPLPGATNGFGTNGGFYAFDGTFGYGDYGWLVATSRTNSPAQLQALYPGLIIDFTNSTSGLAYVTNWVFTQYFTNAGYGSPVGAPPILVTVSNPVLAGLTVYNTKFLNVFTNLFHPVSPTTSIIYETTTVGPFVGAPVGSIRTNTTSPAYVTVNNPSGEFFVFPPFYSTNFCLPDFLGVFLTNVVATTNIFTSAATNIVTVTNTSGFSSTTFEISLFTNYIYEVNPVNCVTSAPATTLYQGIQKIQFVKAPYDSESGNFWSPITNSYTLTAVSPNGPQVQYLQRIVTTPDFDFAAEELTTGPSSTAHGVGDYARNLNFNQLNAYSGEAGPGTIVAPTTIYFNNSGPVFLNGTVFSDLMNGTPFFTETPGGDTSDTFYGLYYVWGSFDATTNPPTVYPDGTSILNFQREIEAQVSTTPSGPLTATNGISYNVVFAESGGEFQPPFEWTATPPVLPPGLSLTSNPDSTATVSGTPTKSGTFNFTLMLMDSLGRSGQWKYTITINP